MVATMPMDTVIDGHAAVGDQIEKGDLDVSPLCLPHESLWWEERCRPRTKGVELVCGPQIGSGGEQHVCRLDLIRDFFAAHGFEGSHGKCTKTFTKKVRRQLRPPA